MQLTIKHYDISATIETSEDITLDEVMNQFNALLISATFSQEGINEWIIEKARELKKIKKD
jgi:hypothetical protein